MKTECSQITLDTSVINEIKINYLKYQGYRIRFAYYNNDYWFALPDIYKIVYSKGSKCSTTNYCWHLKFESRDDRLSLVRKFKIQEEVKGRDVIYFISRSGLDEILNILNPHTNYRDNYRELVSWLIDYPHEKRNTEDVTNINNLSVSVLNTLKDCIYFRLQSLNDYSGEIIKNLGQALTEVENVINGKTQNN